MEQGKWFGRKVSILALACLVLLGTAAPVMADLPEPELQSAAAGAPLIQASEYGTPSAAGITAGYQSYRREGEERAAALESPPFVAERNSSRHAYADYTPSQAEELALSTFGETFARLNAEPARLLSDVKLDQNLGHGSAVITAEGRNEILEADQPIEAKNAEGETEKVDLTLEKGPEGFEPGNPVTEVSIGATAGEGIAVGEEGLTVTQAGAEESKGRLLGDKNVFFGEVEEGSQTDLIASPTAHGVELFDMLRSAESPETLRFEFEMPAGDTLRASVGGGAEILDSEGSLVGMVPKPHGEDAQGSYVAVELEVEGHSVVLRTEHREEDLAYPILIDPEVLWQFWGYWYGGQNLQGLNYWHPAGNVGGNISAGQTPFPWAGGLFLGIGPQVLNAGNYAAYYLNSPNTNSYISDVEINPFFRNDGGCNGYEQPFDFAGYYNFWSNAWNYIDYNNASQLGWTHRTGVWGHQYEFGMTVNANGYNLPCARYLGAGGIAFHMGDWAEPSMASATSSAPGGWITGSTPFSISVDATDVGLGVKEFAFVPGAANPGNPVPKAVGCVGNYENPCPTRYVGAFSFVGANFPSGEDNLSVTARSPTNVVSPNSAPVTIKIDPEPPVVRLNGQLQTAIQHAGVGEQQGEGGPELTQPVYNLGVEATDGVEGTTNPALRRSGVKTVEVTVMDATGSKVESTKSFANPKVPCSQGSCEEKVTYAVAMTGLTAGKHKLRVKAWDYAGNKPAELEKEFEYIPATGLTEEDVTQRFLLPDGQNHGEGSYQGPELAVNVMNGNVVYHQRDVDVEGPSADLEAELFYNSQLPREESSEFGRGWTLAQMPSLKPSGNTATALTGESALAANVSLPQEVGKEQFSAKLDAVVTKEPGGGYSLSEEGGADAPATVFDANGRAVEAQTSATASVQYAYASGHLSEIAVDDPGTTDLAPPPVKRAPSMVPVYVSSFGSTGTGNGQVSHPADVAVDAKGNSWVADSGNNRIEEFTPGGEFIKSLGSGGTGNGQFTTPKSLAFDASGDLWVLDSGNNRLEEFGPTGAFVRAAGTKGAGNGQFNGPEAFAIAPSGHILVSDTGNYRIVELDAMGGWIRVLGPTGSGELKPTGIDVAPEGKIWVADWSHNRVIELGGTGEVIRRVGSEGSGEAQFKRPDAITVGVLGEVWVGDQENERVQELTKEGEYVTQFGAAGSGTGQFSFGYPLGIATDNEGSLLVTDTNDNRVEHWQIPHYGYKAVFAAVFGSAGTGAGQYRHPGGLAVDEHGDVWIPDTENNRLQELNRKGEFVRQLGGVGTGNGQFQSPKSIAFTNDGEFWVADSGNNRLEEFTETGEFIKSVGTLGSGNGQFNGPESIAIAPDGHIWVADTYNHRIVELDEAGIFIKVVNPTGLGSIEPTGIAFGPGGNAWIADWMSNRVVEISPPGALLRQFGTVGEGKGQFNRPDTVTVDSRGIVYVVDQNNSRVQVFNQSGEYLSQFGGSGAGAGQFSFAYPTGVAADGRGDIWVSDNNNRIQKWLTGSWVPAEEEPIPAHDDPSVSVTTSAGLVTAVVGAQAGTHHYGHSGELLTSDEGPEGTTRYEYETTPQMLKKITLPNGTTASIRYEAAGRATEVTVDPAGTPPAKWTKFSYVQEIGSTVAQNHGVQPGSREVIVEPETGARTFYAIDAAGDVVKSWNVEVAPKIFSESGTLTQASNEKRIDGNDTQELFIKAFAPEGVKKIQFIVNGSTIADEKICTGTAAECEYESLQWIVEPQDLPVGTMWIEVVVTSRVEEKGEPRKSSARWWVTVPYVPPPEAGIPQPPKYKKVHEFREEYGLDLDLNPVAEELALHARVWETIDAWWTPATAAGQVANATWERWGIPLRYVDEQELEYREAYMAQDGPLIREWAKEHAWNRFGGYYGDERAGGLLRVGFTANQAELIAQMKAELGGRLAAPSRVVGFPTPPSYTVESVEGAAIAVQAYGVSHPDNIVEADFDSVTNRVHVSALNVAAAEAEASSVAGSLARFEFVQAPEPIRPWAGRYRDSGPIKGGDYVRTITAPSHACTAGFGAAERSPPGQPTHKFLLTAGHCYGLGEIPRRASNRAATLPSEWHKVGEVVRNALPQAPAPGETDALAISLGSESLTPTEIFKSRPVGPLARPSEWQVLEKLCYSGPEAGSVPACGISAGEAQYSYNTDGVHTGKMLGIRVLGAARVGGPGDSGAPVWNDRTGRSVGIVSGGSKASQEFYVTPLRSLPTSASGIPQPGALEALSRQVGPLALNEG